MTLLPYFKLPVVMNNYSNSYLKINNKHLMETLLQIIYLKVGKKIKNTLLLKVKWLINNNYNKKFLELIKPHLKKLNTIYIKKTQ